MSTISIATNSHASYSWWAITPMFIYKVGIHVMLCRWEENWKVSWFPARILKHRIPGQPEGCGKCNGWTNTFTCCVSGSQVFHARTICILCRTSNEVTIGQRNGFTTRRNYFSTCTYCNSKTRNQQGKGRRAAFWNACMISTEEWL